MGQVGGGHIDYRLSARALRFALFSAWADVKAAPALGEYRLLRLHLRISTPFIRRTQCDAE
jgi:hypothetical protein